MLCVQGDVLPPNLLELQVAECSSATPLLRLTRLTSLAMLPHCTMEAHELQRLTALKGLQKMPLSYTRGWRGVGEDACEAGADAWPLLSALHYLQLREVDVGAATLSALPELDSLTRLVLDSPQVLNDVLWGDDEDGSGSDDDVASMFMYDRGMFALALALPSGLRELQLVGLTPWADFHDGENSPSEAARMHLVGSRALMQAAAELPHLHTLKLDLADNPPAAAELAALLQPLRGSSSLRSLALPLHGRLIDDALAALFADGAAPLARCLERLDVSHTCITHAGVQHLSCLKQLRRLSLQHCIAAPSFSPRAFDASIKRLRRRIPGLRVSGSG